jgi:hypothetical protein
MSKPNILRKIWDNLTAIRLLYAFAALLSLSGLIVLFFFLFQISDDYSVFGDNNVDLDASAKVGDFTGGIIGSVWSFAGVLLFFIALMLQRKEFKSQREVLILQKQELSFQKLELRETRKEFIIQNRTLKAQRFEMTFFNLLALHNQIVNDIDYDKHVSLGTSGVIGTYVGRSSPDFGKTEIRTVKGRDVFRDRFKNFNKSLHNGSDFIENYMRFYEKRKTDFGHYFRNLYRIIKMVHETEFLDKNEIETNLETQNKISNYYLENFKERYKYTSIVRAQLSDYELLLLFYNCLSPNGNKKFKPLIEEYAILKNMPQQDIYDIEWISRYSKSAFSNKNQPMPNLK